MVDATEKIWAVFGNHGLLAFRDDRPHSVEYTRSDLVAELEAENERLRNMLDGYGRLDAEAAIAEREAEAQLAEARKALEQIDALDEAMGHELTARHAFEAVSIAHRALTGGQEDA